MRITDPCRRVICLPVDLHLPQETGDPPPELLLDDYRWVIETPACLIEMSTEQVYYFRSIGRNVTMLIEVIFQNGEWIAVKCLKNPAASFILGLLQTGKFIPGSMLG